MNDAAQAVMAVSFFGTIAVTIHSITTVWGKRIDARKGQTTPLTDAVERRLERIEVAVDVIAVEVERIAEAQRFAVRLANERGPQRIADSPGQVNSSRTATPH